MKPGDKFPIVLEVVRPFEPVENFIGDDGKVTEWHNVRGNMFWAKPLGSVRGPLIPVCNDGESEARLLSRRAIVDLIECGVAG